MMDDSATEHRTVLIADDDAFTRLLLETTLESRPAWQVLSARDGPEALKMAQDHRPNIMLLDLRMPGMDGITLCQRIKADQSLSGTAVIMLTGAKDYESEAAAHEAGADGFVTKPFSPAALLKMLDSVLHVTE
ncbi:MAG: hypothetical protein QOF51_888 [Chloroflexota bacterium]|jgi:two-component system phosphate regulon response regulator PhoB|nr:hypothetical protein [Chloroflexota bacterium]